MPQNDHLQSMERMVSELAEKPAITRGDFLDLAEQAIIAHRENPANREQIARIMTGVWMGFDEVSNDEVMHEIGGRFADLEVPDEHISLEGAESIDELWANLAKDIKQLKEDGQDIKSR